MMVKEEQHHSHVYAYFMAGSREYCLAEYRQYEAKYPPNGYLTAIHDEGIVYGFLGDGYYIIAKRTSTCG